MKFTLEDYEYVHMSRDRDLKIGVNKNGGGTVGRYYRGEWSITYKWGNEDSTHAQTFYSGTSKTHNQVGREVADILEEV